MTQNLIPPILAIIIVGAQHLYLFSSRSHWRQARNEHSGTAIPSTRALLFSSVEPARGATPRRQAPAMSQEAVDLKNQGNKSFTSGDWPTAIDFYSKAIALNDKEPLFLTNRAQVCLTSRRPGLVGGRVINLYSLAGIYQVRGVRICDRRYFEGSRAQPEACQSKILAVAGFP